MTSQQIDPYVSPQSDIRAADSAAYAETKFFSFSGRIGRLRYMAYSMGLMLLISLGAGLLSAILVPALSGFGEDGAGIVMAIMMLFVYGFSIVGSFVLAVRRANDFDKSGWTSLLLLVPLLNIIFGLALMFVPGTKEENRFGAPPAPNSGMVTFLAILLPLIMVIGILAAVAIPAYQQYVERAAAMQNQPQ